MARLCIYCRRKVANGSDRHAGIDMQGKPIYGRAPGCSIVGKKGIHDVRRPTNEPEPKMMAGIPDIIASIPGGSIAPPRPKNEYRGRW
jgi:hypothetical protein